MRTPRSKRLKTRFTELGRCHTKSLPLPSQVPKGSCSISCQVYVLWPATKGHMLQNQKWVLTNCSYMVAFCLLEARVIIRRQEPPLPYFLCAGPHTCKAEEPELVFKHWWLELGLCLPIWFRTEPKFSYFQSSDLNRLGQGGILILVLNFAKFIKRWLK